MATKTKKEKKEKFDYRTIKSFEDACVRLNINASIIPDVSMLPADIGKAIVNFYKLTIIIKAINDGWTPDWSNYNQYKYYAWFGVDSSGFGFDGSGYGYTDAGTGVGSRLCTDTREKALYMAKNFQEEYRNYLLFSKE